MTDLIYHQHIFKKQADPSQDEKPLRELVSSLDSSVPGVN